MIRRILTIKGLHNYNYQDFSTAVDFIIANWKKYPFQISLKKNSRWNKSTKHLTML